MHCALSCTSCIHFLFVWVQSLAHPASVTSSAPPSSPGGARRGDRKCIRSAVHWVTRSMVARGPGLADGVPAVAAAVFKAPRIYDYSLNPHRGSKRSRDRWGGEVKGSKVWPCVSCRISALKWGQIGLQDSTKVHLMKRLPGPSVHICSDALIKSGSTPLTKKQPDYTALKCSSCLPFLAWAGLQASHRLKVI